MICGVRGSSPSFLRRCETWTSIDRSNASSALPRTKSTSCSRVSTRPGRSANTRRRSNSYVVSARSSPRSVTRRAATSIAIAPAWTKSGAGADLAERAADLGAHACEQLARRERLGDVVVRATLEAHHAIDLLAARGHHDDRRRDAGAQLAADLEAVDPGEHEIEQDDVGALAQRRTRRRRARSPRASRGSRASRDTAR